MVTVTLGGVEVRLEPPTVVQYWRVSASGQPLTVLGPALLRECWKSKNAPAYRLPLRNVEALGEAVVAELFERGASLSEIDAACHAAWLLCVRTYQPEILAGADDEDDEDLADFCGGQAEDSPSS